MAVEGSESKTQANNLLPCSKEKDSLLPSNTFYGLQSKKRSLHIQRSLNLQAKRFKQEVIPVAFHSRILGPSTQWKTFFRQQDAFEYSRSYSEDLHVFAFESDQPGMEAGQRLYLAASYPVFWHYYMQLAPSHRHHYEVIPEGSACKLYFDLEFHRHDNVTAEGPTMVETFIKFIMACLKAVYNLPCSRQQVLDLDASTEEKFSRHLIFQFENAVFSDNINAGNFVKAIFAKLKEYLLGSSNEETIFKDVEHASSVSMTQAAHIFQTASDISKSCGSKLRMLVDQENPDQSAIKISSKHGDPSSLENTFNNICVVDLEQLGQLSSCDGSNPAKQCQASGHTDTCTVGEDEVRKEKDSIESEVLGPDSLRLLDIFQFFSTQELCSLFVKSRDGKEICFSDLGVYTKNRNFRLFKSCKLKKNNPLSLSFENKFLPQNEADKKDDFAVFLSSLIANVSYNDNVKVLSFAGFKGKDTRWPRIKSGPDSSLRHSVGDNLEGFSKSLYPEVDDYIQDLVGDKSHGGMIRHWTYFPTAEILNYDIVGYRYCFNIKRQHKSNNIKLVVDLKKGIWYQKCYDPDCQAVNFKSDEYPLPENILPAHFFKDDAFDDINEDELCLMALEEAEDIFCSFQDPPQPVEECWSTSLHQSLPNEEEEILDRALAIAADELENSFC